MVVSGSCIAAAFGAEAFDLQEMVLHPGLEVAFDVLGHFLHEAEVDFLDLAAVAAQEMVVMPGFQPATDVIAQLAVRIGGGQQDATPGQALQDAVDRGEADVFKPLLQAGPDFKGIEDGVAGQKQVDHRPDLGGDPVAVLFQSCYIGVGGHGIVSDGAVSTIARGHGQRQSFFNINGNNSYLGIANGFHLDESHCAA